MRAELFSQGDQERAAGQPISPLCDRTTTSRAGSQVNFVEFVVAPLYSLLCRIFPDVGELMENCTATRQFWQAALVEETAAAKAGEERDKDIQKVEARMVAFQEKYSETLNVVSRRKRDMCRRLSTMPAPAPQYGGSGAGSRLGPGSSLAYVPVIPQSTRTSAASVVSSRKGSGSVALGSPMTPSAPNAQTEAAAAGGGSPDLRRSPSGVAVPVPRSPSAASLVARSGSCSGRGTGRTPSHSPATGSDLV